MNYWNRHTFEVADPLVERIKRDRTNRRWIQETLYWSEFLDLLGPGGQQIVAVEALMLFPDQGRSARAAGWLAVSDRAVMIRAGLGPVPDTTFRIEYDQIRVIDQSPLGDGSCRIVCVDHDWAPDGSALYVKPRRRRDWIAVSTFRLEAHRHLERRRAADEAEWAAVSAVLEPDEERLACAEFERVEGGPRQRVTILLTTRKVLWRHDDSIGGFPLSEAHVTRNPGQGLGEFMFTGVWTSDLDGTGHWVAHTYRAAPGASVHRCEALFRAWVEEERGLRPVAGSDETDDCDDDDLDDWDVDDKDDRGDDGDSGIRV